MLQWIIIGGGIQGSTVATFLLKKNKTTINQLRIIDPNPKPLEKLEKMYIYYIHAILEIALCSSFRYRSI
ncbi:NAD-binding protein [Bacillus sp. m3-13]|uniref:NAD-binding protein n=1 Tax=Bacillus sp. m3-13 TaxID=406124 RepID=UPI0001E89920|nr:NAD-binding protein [Bacillus sp. m3-13]